MDVNQGTPEKQPQQSQQQPQRVSNPNQSKAPAGRVAAVTDLIRAGQGLPAEQAPQEDEDEQGAGQESELAGPDEGELAGPDEGNEDAREPGEQGPPATLDEAAKRLGMTRQELNKLPVQVGAETMTLGELKAKLPELLKVGADRDKLASDRGEWELERSASHRNIRALVDMLPPQAVSPQVLRELTRQHEAMREHELESLHFARPDWANPQYATGQRDAMMKTAAKYGFSRVEVEGVLDHRQILLLQDYATLKSQMLAAKDAGRKVGEGPGESKRAAQGAPVESSNQRGKPARDDVARRVSRLMGR